MENEMQKCPMCGTKLKMINGRMTCKSCGYYVRNKQGDDTYQSPAHDSQQWNGEYQNKSPYQSGNTNQAGNGNQSGNSYQAGNGNQGRNSYQTNNMNQSNNPYQANSTYQSNSNYQSGSQQASTPKKSSGTVIAVAIIISAAVCILLGVFLVNLFGHTADIINGDMRANHTQSSSSSGSLLDYIVGSMENEASSGGDGESSRESGSSSPTAVPSAIRRVPQSTFFIQMAEAIWEKGYRTITAEEYASLTALKIDTDEKTISYQLNYGETQGLTFQSYTDKKLSDLASFPGLEFLSIDDDFDPGDLDGLNNLYAVYSENTIKELADIISVPENILELGVESTFFDKSLEGLEVFPNLEYLAVDYASLEDISILTQYPNLYGLILEDCDNLTDYSPLLSLTNLGVLGISSSQLKTLDFIKAMPNLTYLRVEDSKITSLDALASCPNLTGLYLTDNYSIVDDDYSVVADLEMLEDLEISLGHLFDLPSFEKLTRLQQLSLKNVDDPAPLKDAVNVVYLYLDDISWWDLDVLTSMENLLSLTMVDCHLDTLAPLTKFSNLMVLDLEDTNVYGNIEEIFGIPNLYYLSLDDCKVGIDFDNLPVNETLQILDLSDLEIMEDPSFTSQNTTKVNLSAHFELFNSFPNLSELYLKSLQIDSIDFVTNLPYLQYLDITDNDVTSLKPLEALEYFQRVHCGKNTILENVSSDSKITVITTD